MSRSRARGDNTFYGRQYITKEDNYENIKYIADASSRIKVIEYIKLVIMVIAVASFLYLAFEVAAHRKTLESIETQSKNALLYLMTVLNQTSDFTRDITTEYSRARLNHRRTIGTITQEEYDQYLLEMNDGLESYNDSPFEEMDHTTESSATHFMHIILRALHLEDEEAMVARFQLFLDGFDSGMQMLKDANRTNLVQNTSQIAKRINDVIYSQKAREISIQGADVLKGLMDDKEGTLNILQDKEKKFEAILNRLNQLTKTPLVADILNNQDNTLRIVNDMADDVQRGLKGLIDYFESNQGHDLIDNADSLVGSLSKYRTIEKVTSLLEMVVAMGTNVIGKDR